MDLRPILLALLLFALCTASAEAGIVSRKRGGMLLQYDLSTGTATVSWKGGARISRFHSVVRIGGRDLTSRDYPNRTLSTKGRTTTITLTGGDRPTMRQRFTLASAEYMLAQVEVEGKNLSSNRMAPVVAEGSGCVDIGPAPDARALRVPFDNDQWARYDAGPMEGPGTSYEVSAFYDNASRRGIVVGSVTHDTWKTGVSFTGRSGKLDRLEVFGGISDKQTRDVMPHGSVIGDVLVSPKVMLGYFADWRDGLDAYARANVAEASPLKWTKGVPFGWNSWGKVQSKLTHATAIGVSDFIAKELQPRGFQNGGTVYVNLDSYWDNLSESELLDFVEHVHAKGQKAGIYWAPFAYWGSSMSQRVEGSSFTYGDIVTRTADGTPQRLDGAFAVDPTHPGTRARMHHFIDRFKRLGFDYIKLDFLTHGALEGGSNNGRLHDPAIHTGIQAYNRGMREIAERIDGTMFVSTSIAPLFPYRYAHAHRVACDAFGGIGETEYTMNSAGYGWWMSGRLYAFNDPDHLVLEGHTPHENRSRVTSGAIAGTVFLNGDDLTKPIPQALAKTNLTNKSINAVVRLGKPFRPVEGNTGDRAPEVFTLKHGRTHYLAIFNYDAEKPATKRIDLTRGGLDASESYRVTDLWEGTTRTAQGTLEVHLAPAQSALLRLEVAP